MENATSQTKTQAAMPFDIGGIKFAAVRATQPRPHWRVRLEETGEVFEPGTGGISNESVPKMKADIQYLLDRISKGDTSDFRRRFGLPPTPASESTCVECGATDADMVGCPDGAEICRDCFGAGRH
ncbi:hypothetical protein [Diaphorobacter sp. LR2014-1]|uniref:hypothetical protein n=1 Tax=Diaphorobacter sp. LR2014-1 TaxID=1933219 RepID=UPI000CDB0F2E|nr:hypothetical protein [Diaphorobacter sp. LR2014-1]